MSRVLIDTQALIWFAEDASVLSKRALSLVDDPVTVRLDQRRQHWEIKIPLGKPIGRTSTRAWSYDEESVAV